MEGKNDKTHSHSRLRPGKHAGHVEAAGVSFTRDEKDLVMLRDELYDGSWDEMLNDLKNRLTGKPYIFKLVNRIQQDMNAIERLRALEKEKGVNLRDLI